MITWDCQIICPKINSRNPENWTLDLFTSLQKPKLPKQFIQENNVLQPFIPIFPFNSSSMRQLLRMQITFSYATISMLRIKAIHRTTRVCALAHTLIHKHAFVMVSYARQKYFINYMWKLLLLLLMLSYLALISPRKSNVKIPQLAKLMLMVDDSAIEMKKNMKYSH